MISLKSEIDRFKMRQLARKELEAQLRQADEGARRQFEYIRQCIEDGESTGDRWFDYAILRHEDLTGEKAKIYRRLEAEVAEHQLEPMLMVCRYEELRGCSGFGGEKEQHMVEVLRFGVLRAQQLSILLRQPYLLGFPTERFANYSSDRRFATAIQGKLPEMLQCPIVGDGDSRADLTIGTEAVEQLFAGWPSYAGVRKELYAALRLRS